MTATAAELVAEVKASVENLTTTRTQQLIRGAVVVDLREPAELAGGLIDGAVHAPRGMLDFYAEPPAAAAVTAPAAVGTASPASAAGCSPFVCGDGNHNETAGRDRRRRPRRALEALALAVAITAPVAVATASPAAALACAGIDPLLARIALNHNESVGSEATCRRT